jgi:hypothetical protein
LEGQCGKGLLGEFGRVAALVYDYRVR